MIVELGHFALILALFVSLIQFGAPMIGLRTRDARLMAMADAAAPILFALIAGSFLALIWAHVAIRLFRDQRLRELAFREAAHLQNLGRLGQSRRLHAFMGSYPVAFRRGGLAFRRKPPA